MSENTQISTSLLERKIVIENLVKEIEVISDEKLEIVSDTIKQIKILKKAVEDEMDKTIAPAKEIINHTKEKYDPLIKTCINAEQALKAKAGLYMQEKENARLKAEQKIADDLESGKIKKEETAIKKLEALPEQKTTQKTENSSLTMRKIKDIEIIDRNAIPDEYWIVDEVKVKKVALAGVEIPGVKVIEKVSMMSK